LAFSFLLILAAGTVQPETDYLAQIQKGYFLCNDPDPASKTCSNLDKFVINKDGTIINTGELLIIPSQPVTLEVSSKSTISGSVSCGTLAMEDLQAGIVRAKGQPIPADRNAIAIQKLSGLFTNFFGKQVCESLMIQEGRLMKVGQIDGLNITLPSIPVQWVAPSDDYRVAPKP
jgi:hypothetical protein